MNSVELNVAWKVDRGGRSVQEDAVQVVCGGRVHLRTREPVATGSLRVSPAGAFRGVVIDGATAWDPTLRDPLGRTPGQVIVDALLDAFASAPTLADALRTGYARSRSTFERMSGSSYEHYGRAAVAAFEWLPGDHAFNWAGVFDASLFIVHRDQSLRMLRPGPPGPRRLQLETLWREARRRVEQGLPEAMAMAEARAVNRSYHGLENEKIYGVGVDSATSFSVGREVLSDSDAGWLLATDGYAVEGLDAAFRQGGFPGLETVGIESDNRGALAVSISHRK